MRAVTQYGGNGNDLSWNGDTLYERRVVYEGTGSRAPGQGEKIERDQPTQYKDGEVRPTAGKDFGENEGEGSHGHQRIQQRPQNSKGHVAVPDLEILLDQVAQQKTVVAIPHRGVEGAPDDCNATVKR